MLRAIAVDDEPIALEVIKSLTEKVIFVEMASYFTDGGEAISFLKTCPVDLIFLDIHMPGMSGLDFLNALADPPMVIFTTAYGEHALKGFEMNAVDYLLKPFSLVRFLKACHKAYAQHFLLKDHQRSVFPQPFIYVKSGYENIKVEFKEILYAEGLGNYVRLVLANSKIVTRLTMKEAEALLSGHNFLRSHRSYIVSINHIQRFDKKSIRIMHTDLPVGPRYLEKMQQMIFHKNEK